MRTAGVVLMDTPLTDGQIFLSALDVNGYNSSAHINTPFAGYYRLTLNNTNVTFVTPFSGQILRLGLSDDAQQQFGQAAPSGGYQGAQNQKVTTSTPFTTPYGPTGRPPFSASSFGQPVTGRPKGIQINSIVTTYGVFTAALTAFTVTLYKVKYNAGSAPTVTKLINAVALNLTVADNQQVTTTISNPAMLTDFTSAYVLEYSVNAGATAELDYYGTFLNCSYNYN